MPCMSRDNHVIFHFRFCRLHSLAQPCTALWSCSFGLHSIAQPCTASHYFFFSYLFQTLLYPCKSVQIRPNPQVVYKPGCLCNKEVSLLNLNHHHLQFKSDVLSHVTRSRHAVLRINSHLTLVSPDLASHLITVVT